jgi:hypothetical protein
VRPIDPDDVCLRGTAVVNIGDVADIDGRAIDDFDRQIVELGDLCRPPNYAEWFGRQPVALAESRYVERTSCRRHSA